MRPQTYTAPISEREKEIYVPFLNVLIDAAIEVIDEKFLTDVHIDDKSNGTPVTDADRGAEAVMRNLIEKTFPTHGIFGEEYGVKEAVADAAGVTYRWILDPIDGTRSFINHSFLFGTLIALERDSGSGFRPILSTITHPAAGVRVIGTADEAVMYVKTATRNDKRKISVKPCTQLSDAVLLTTSHWTTPEQKGDERMQRLIDAVKLYRTTGDCFGYFSVASGGGDIMVDPDLCYWDVAALLPVVEGAGGTLTSMTGGNPLTDLSAVCTAGGIHGEVVALLNA